LKVISRVILSLVLFVSIPVSGNCVKKEYTKLKVVATTTHIASIVSEIGRDKVEVITLVPGNMCPGHFDMEPGTMKKIVQSKLFISHSWEKWITNLFSKIDSRELIKKSVSTQGNWMMPEVNTKAASEIYGILLENNMQNKDYYLKNLNEYTMKVETLSADTQKKVNCKGIKLICSEQQKDFLAWLGFTVIKAYGRQDDLNVREVADIMALAKKEDVRIVVDNLQSGADTGLRMAKDLHAHHVTLSNFPLNNSYFETLQENIKSLEKALNE
jgi:ABC-type Zn uptake system ZnuABC Zn-binding protein ZnuA